MLSDSGSVHRLYSCLQCLHCFRPSDTQICERCNGSKVCDHFVLEEQQVNMTLRRLSPLCFQGRHTFEELQLLQETCDRRKTDGSQCIIPVSIDQPKERSRALERALERVLPTAQLRWVLCLDCHRVDA